MNPDFHYYATYCAATLAGYSHEDSAAIAASDRFVDRCTETFLTTVKAPLSAATTQLPLELLDTPTDPVGLQKITRIWASFHFLPYDLQAMPPKRSSKRYRNKYRLICRPNGELLQPTVELAKGKNNEAIGIAMHILSDTWAHQNFAGTPSLVINNTNYYFYELIPDGDSFIERKINFRYSAFTPDDPDKSVYTQSPYYNSENSIINLGHGRAGYLPDYSYVRFKYMPAWGEYEEIIKDNPSDYLHAFCQMITALKYLRGTIPSFELNRYDWEAIAPYRTEIEQIIGKRQLDASEDWKVFGEKLSGQTIPPYSQEDIQEEYIRADKDKKDETFLGKFIIAALAQKSMITGKIFQSGNKLAGYSVDYKKKGFRGDNAYKKLLPQKEKESR